MKQYPRLPAFIVLAVTAAAGYSYLNRSHPDTADSARYESRIELGKADDEDRKNYVLALAKEGQYERLIPAFKYCLDHNLADRSISFIYIEALGRHAANAPQARQKLIEYLESQVQTDPKIVLDAFDRPEIAALQNAPDFNDLYKTAQKNAAD